MPSWDSDLALAHQLADDADSLTSARFLAQDLKVETKPDLTPVSDADRGVEEAARARLAVERPGDDVLGEEFGVTVGTGSGRRWILDPVDGTKNFVRGVPVWATLVALVEDGEVVVGVVSAPALGRRWWASTGGGAWSGPRLSGARRLQVSAVNDLADASLSYSDLDGWAPHGGSAAFEAVRRRVWRTRAYGDFWSHVLVAEGAVDLAVEPELSAWDIAALVPVVREAGGRITGFDGAPALDAGCAVTSNGLLHEQFLTALADR